MKLLRYNVLQEDNIWKEKKVFSFGHVKCEMPSRYANGDVEYVVGLEFRGNIWVGNTC